MLGTSPAIRDILKTIGRVASQECPALIEGEPGTWKELVARLIHLHGSRSSGPIVVLKCTDFAPLWLDGELFGHEAGALPGVAIPRAGRVEQAAGGMLVIDEVSALPLAQQSKLLRLLADRQAPRRATTSRAA